MLNVVLVNPEIPWNTGNIGRTCVAVGATLHLVGRLGFRIDDREVRRAGLDYWPQLRWHHHKDFESFLKSIPVDPNLIFLSTRGRRVFWKAPFSRRCYLVFGNESSGLPLELRNRYRERQYRIPIRRQARSLNVSTAAGIVLYEALRQIRAIG